MAKVNKINPDLTEMAVRFTKVTIPTEPLELSKGVTVTDADKMIYTHFATLRQYPKNRTYLPFYYRLLQLLLILEKK